MIVSDYEHTPANADTLSHLVRRLIELQGARSNQEFADAYGLDRSHWSRIRAGDRPMSMEMIKRVISRDKKLIRYHRMDLEGAA